MDRIDLHLPIKIEEKDRLLLNITGQVIGEYRRFSEINNLAILGAVQGNPNVGLSVGYKAEKIVYAGSGMLSKFFELRASPTRPRYGIMRSSSIIIELVGKLKIGGIEASDIKGDSNHYLEVLREALGPKGPSGPQDFLDK